MKNYAYYTYLLFGRVYRSYSEVFLRTKNLRKGLLVLSVISGGPDMDADATPGTDETSVPAGRSDLNTEAERPGRVATVVGVGGLALGVAGGTDGPDTGQNPSAPIGESEPSPTESNDSPRDDDNSEAVKQIREGTKLPRSAAVRIANYAGLKQDLDWEAQTARLAERAKAEPWLEAALPSLRRAGVQATRQVLHNNPPEPNPLGGAGAADVPTPPPGGRGVWEILQDIGSGIYNTHPALLFVGLVAGMVAFKHRNSIQEFIGKNKNEEPTSWDEF